MEREKVSFDSGESRCAAWHYPGKNGGCIVMASGAGVTKEPGTDAFARRFQSAGFAVLAFDFRHFGESGGLPRQVIRIAEQLADWQSALSHVQTLPDVDRGRVAVWGFSLSGGQVFQVAAKNPWLGAAIAQSPLVDGRAAMPSAIRSMTVAAFVKLLVYGVLDALGGGLGLRPLLVPLAGSRGDVAMLTTADALDASAALDPRGEHSRWQREVAARFALRAGGYQPGRQASQVQIPLLVVTCNQDASAPAAAAVRAAGRAPRGECVALDGTHYSPFVEAHESAVAVESSFLERHLLSVGRGRMGAPDEAGAPRPWQHIIW